MHIDYFSGDVIDLERGHRGAQDVLAVLVKNPWVSTWDMSYSWLRAAIDVLEMQGLIAAQDEPYPWHRYTVTDAGLSVLEQSGGV